MVPLGFFSHNKGRAIGVAPVLLATLFIGSCARFADNTDVVAFANATTSVTSASKQALSTARQLDKLLAQTIAHKNYVARTDVEWPESKPLNKNTEALWQSRINVLKGIEEYANALQDIGETDAPQRAAAASQSLAYTVIGLSSKLQGQSVLPVNLLSEGVRLGSSAFLARRMRQTIKRTDPIIQRAAVLLIADIKRLSKARIDRAGRIRRHRLHMLKYFQQDAFNNTTQLYDAYQSMMAQDRMLKQLEQIYFGLPNGLQKMAAAHSALVKSEDKDRELASFVTTANVLADTLSQYRTARN